MKERRLFQWKFHRLRLAVGHHVVDAPASHPTRLGRVQPDACAIDAPAFRDRMVDHTHRLSFGKRRLERVAPGCVAHPRVRRRLELGLAARREAGGRAREKRRDRELQLGTAAARAAAPVESARPRRESSTTRRWIRNWSSSLRTRSITQIVARGSRASTASRSSTAPRSAPRAPARAAAAVAAVARASAYAVAATGAAEGSQLTDGSIACRARRAPRGVERGGYEEMFFARGPHHREDFSIS